MRNSDGSFAGSGTWKAFYEEYDEDKEIYRDHKVHVRLPYDFMTAEERKALNGPVKTYFVEKEDKH